MNKPETVICLDTQQNEHEVSVSDLTFRLGVYGLLIGDGKILLSPQRGGHDFPGGGLRVHESIEQGLVREFHEETGLEIRVGDVVTVESTFHKTSRNDHWNSTNLFYLVEKVGGELSVDYLEEDEKDTTALAEWIPLENIGNLKFVNSRTTNVEIIEKAVRMSATK